MHKSRRRRIGLVILAMLVALAVAELTVRIFRLAPPLPKLYRDNIYVPDPKLPYRMKPNIEMTVTAKTGEFRQSIRHNSEGFRDVEHSKQKLAGTFRILGVGDSFTYGAGAEYTNSYLAILEQKLQGVTTSRVEIIKAGVGGYFPAAERLLVEHVGLAYDPDLILLGFNETDLFETYLGLDAVKVYPGFLKSSQARELGYARTWLTLHSHLARLIISNTSGEMVRRKKEAFANSPELEENVWRSIEKEFTAISNMAAQRGARVAICYIPLSYGSDEQALGELERICERNGITFIDTTPYLEQVSHNGPVYWEHDGHCNAIGYRAIADAVFDAIQNEGATP